MRPSEAMLDRLERVIETLQDNSVKMGQMLAVHDEKLDKQDRIDAVLFEKIESVHREVNRQSSEIKAGCERDIRKVDERLRTIEKKMWTIAGAIAGTAPAGDDPPVFKKKRKPTPVGRYGSRRMWLQNLKTDKMDGK